MTRLWARARGPGSSSVAVNRLKRLRLSLTVLFTIALGLGLLILSLVVLRKDSELRQESLESTMRTRVTGASRLLYYSNRGVLRLDGVREDDLTTGTPEVRVYAGTGARPRLVFESDGRHLPLGYPQLAAIARQAARAGEFNATTVNDPRLGDVRLVAAPFYRDPNGGPAGAVVSASSLSPVEDAHRQLIATIVIGCGVLLVLAAGAGYLLAGRSLRPAVRSLAQQEALLSDAAHELRTPVASVRALLESAQLDPRSSDSAIEQARTVAEEMGDTLNALLAWGRLEAGTETAKTTRLRLDQLVDDTVAELGTEGAVELSTSPSVVHGDPVLIRIAVRNLIDNALRYGSNPDDPQAVQVHVASGAVTVSDRGPGLPVDLTRNGVGRFESATTGGTGLGLSIATRIAEIQGGSLKSSRRDGGGAVLRLSLPLDAKAHPGGGG